MRANVLTVDSDFKILLLNKCPFVEENNTFFNKQISIDYDGARLGGSFVLILEE